MMAIELVLASNNEHKHAELCRFFPKTLIVLPRKGIGAFSAGRQSRHRG